MKTNQRWAWTAVIAVGLVFLTVRAEEAAVVKRDRVNLRAQASATSEVITQLKKGETVTVLEEVSARKHKRGEPAKWAKIQLPPNTPVWAYGPGENFSVIGRLDRGTEVKEIRTEGNWMEIEAPANAYAFVAADMLEKSGIAPAPATTELAANANPGAAPDRPPTRVETVKPEPNTTPVIDTTPAPTPAQPVTTAPQPAPAAPADTPPPKRIVTREGTVVYSRSIQAPTSYALENRESHRIVNFLHSESDDISLKKFAGKKVIVTGEELIDQRWTNTPIIEAESVQVVP